MPKEAPILRFDHREIAVIFSLFVFVSLLMFTVGILVGKGLSQAKMDPAPSAALSSVHVPETLATSEGDDAHDAHGAAGAAHHAPAEKAEKTAHAAPPPAAEPTYDEYKAEKLELIPQKKTAKSHSGSSLREPAAKDTAKILDNPKIQGLLEDDPIYRKTKRVASGKIPDSSPKGDYTVQVGSYPSNKAAQDRVEQLKKLGFPHAYFNAKDLGDPKKTWYRVWLGYFIDNESADVSGQILQQRGEVKNYIVRKADTSG